MPTIFIPRRRVDEPIGRSATHRTGDGPLDIAPQRAPESPRRGDTPARRSFSNFLNFYWHPHRHEVETLGGMRVLVAQQLGAIRGQMKFEPERSNIHRPPVGSYGEQFELTG